jgi:hypothetical protein
LALRSVASLGQTIAGEQMQRPGFALVVIFVSLNGCRAQTEADLRVRCAEVLMNCLERSYIDFEVGTRFTATPELRASIRKARTPREYIVLLARQMSTLNDPHVQFVDLEAYYKEHNAAAQPACRYVTGHAGHYWIAVDTENVLNAEALPADDPQRLFELVSVNEVPPPLARSLLLVAPGEHADVLVLDKAGAERHLSLQCAAARASDTQTGTWAPDDLADLKPSLQNDPELKAFGDYQVGVRYIRVTGCNQGNAEAFEGALETLMDSDVLVIDLRDNSGGTLDPVCKILSRLVTRATPYTAFEYRQRVTIIGGEVPIWYEPLMRIAPKPPVYRKPIVVLTDTNTASGGELLAAALQDIRAARVVGHRTAGAGGILGYVTLPDGLKIAYSTARFRHLDGRGIQYVGVLPDVVVGVDYDRIMQDGEAALRASMRRVVLAGVKEAVKLRAAAREREP